MRRMERDPAATNPDLYRVVMENDRVRVLEYRDRPGDRTTPHGHPDSVMVTLSAFRRRLIDGDQSVEVEETAWTWRRFDEHRRCSSTTTSTAACVRATVIELASQAGYRELPTTDPDELAAWFTRGADRKSLELYLEGFRHTVAVMQTREAIERVPPSAWRTSPPTGSCTRRSGWRRSC
jgi:beta-alanine degradation protein BauB